jgi:hypothetical protein
MRITSFFKFTLIAVFFTAMAVCTTSCSDDDDDDNGSETLTLYVPEKITSDNYSYSISYDNDLKIKSINTVNQDNDKYSYEIEYDTQSRISKIKEKWEENNGSASYNGETGYTYTYSDNKLTISIDDNADNAKWIFTFNAEGRPDACVYEDDHSGQNDITYTYDAAGNLIQSVQTRQGSQSNSVNIIYNNDVKGISKDINMSKLEMISLFEISEDLSGILLTWNKSITEINFQYSSGKESNTYTYTNGSNGYPSAFELISKYGGETEETSATITYKEIKK